jgi:hypothetical protein
VPTSENIIEAKATIHRLRAIAAKDGGLAPYELPFVADLLERLVAEVEDESV